VRNDPVSVGADKARSGYLFNLCATDFAMMQKASIVGRTKLFGMGRAQAPLNRTRPGVAFTQGSCSHFRSASGPRAMHFTQKGAR
jgi:hypothetical protein